MLDSALEPSYYLSKNLLLLPWILKLIVDMVNDSTPLVIGILLENVRRGSLLLIGIKSSPSDRMSVLLSVRFKGLVFLCSRCISTINLFNNYKFKFQNVLTLLLYCLVYLSNVSSFVRLTEHILKTIIMPSKLLLVVSKGVLYHSSTLLSDVINIYFYFN